METSGPSCQRPGHEGLELLQRQGCGVVTGSHCFQKVGLILPWQFGELFADDVRSAEFEQLQESFG
ncbi:MAG: hypothetical protein JWN52_8174, partial [Actinomycetia bacterium]|nr:hypothetical protein [Actinomycetes bacterium]